MPDGSAFQIVGASEV